MERISTRSKPVEKYRPVCLAVALALALVLASAAKAVPLLQVGAPAGPADTGIYADYQSSLTDPTETDTAVTSGITLYLAGAYSAQNQELQIGGQYEDPADVSTTPAIGPGTLGLNWSDFSFDAIFNDKGAVVMATVPDGTLGSGSVTVNGSTAFYSTTVFESGFVVPNPPANHDPIKDQDYLFFDVGDFLPLLDNTDPLRLGGAGVPNLADETTSNQAGEIKTATVSATGFDWVHFDLFALTTDIQGQTRLRTTLDGNPGSKDVTWKPDDDDPPRQIPEPGTLALFGVGLVGIGIARRRRRST